MAEKQLDYIGVCQHCQRVVSACSGEMGDKKEQAKHVAQMIRWGLDVRRCTSEEVRAAQWMHTESVRCPCCETVQALEACEVAGCPDGRIMCGRCFKVFWPVAIQTQGGLFDGNGDERNQHVAPASNHR